MEEDGEILMTEMALNKEPQEFMHHCIKAWSGERGCTHIEAAGLTGDNTISTICILGSLEDLCKPRSNEIITATACKQLVQSYLGIEYIEKCKEVIVTYNFGAEYDKCLRNAILLELRNKPVYEKCIKVEEQLTSTYVI